MNSQNVLSAVNQRFIAEMMRSIEKIGPTMLTKTFRNLSIAAMETKAVWQEYVSGGKIPGLAVTVNNPRYREAIRISQTGPMMFEVGVDPSFEKEATQVEKGGKERDLKKEVQGFRNRRISKKGTYYAFIPFRHSTQELQRDKVYAEALKMKKVEVTGTRTDAEGIKRLTYNWNGSKMFNTGTYKNKAGTKDVREKYLGMRRFETSTGKGKSSEYMTFRTLSSKSNPGTWIIPAKKGIGADLGEIVGRTLGPRINRLVAEGIESDMRDLAQKGKKS